jgi:hypothetical protein
LDGGCEIIVPSDSMESYHDLSVIMIALIMYAANVNARAAIDHVG